jgi:hypothetical protein
LNAPQAAIPSKSENLSNSQLSAKPPRLMKTHDETLRETPQARSIASNLERYDEDDILFPDNSIKSGLYAANQLTLNNGQ